MENAKAWLKAHWKPVLAIGLAGLVAIWFLFLRKSSSQGTALTLPVAATGGGASGPGTSTDTTSAPTTGTAPAASAPESFMAWLNRTWNPSYLSAGHGTLQQWESDLVSAFAQQTGQLATDIPKTGLKTAPTVPAYDWFKTQYAGGGYRPPTLPPFAADRTAAGRGTGFRGGDPYPAFAGMDARALGTARAASAAGLPAAPLGTPMRAKQPGPNDVRRSARRQTAITELSRAPGTVSLPQSFSVPIRQTNYDKAQTIFKAPGIL